MRSRCRRFVLFWIFILPVSGAFGQTGKMTTVAGTGTPGSSGDGGPATAAKLNGPYSVTVDAAGSLYIADLLNHRIRKVSAGTGFITTVAGTGGAGFDGDGGPATSAVLDHPEDVAVDAAGNLYIADAFNNRVRKVDAVTGLITTLAGNGAPRYGGDDGPASSAGLNHPTGVALDSAGNVYIADQVSHRIRRVTVATGLISTVAGTGFGGFGGDGGPATAAQLYSPTHIAIDAADNIYIADTLNHRVRKVMAATGIITTIAGNGAVGSGIADRTGSFTGDGGPGTAAQLSDPYYVAVDAAGNAYIADGPNKRVRYLSASTGIINTIAGGGVNMDGCAALTSSLEFPLGVALNAAGDHLYIADYGDNRIRMVTLTDTLSKPKLISITPSSGFRRRSYTVTLTGSGFLITTAFTSNCKPGVTAVSVAGNGISAGDVNVADDTSLIATLTITSDAALGAHDVTVTTEQGTSNPIQFTVTPILPTVTSITPASGVRGSSTSVTLNGTSFDMSPGATHVVVSGRLISVTSVNVLSPTSLTASLVIAANTPLDTYTVQVVTGEGFSNAIAFSVDPQDVTISYAMPQQLNPTDQIPVKLALANPSPDPVRGHLTVTFVPNANNDADDPGVSLINAQVSTRTVDFVFASNNTDAQFSYPGILLRAGTVAGTIQLTITEAGIGTRDITLRNNTFGISVPRLVPVISDVRILNRTRSGFDVEITGYSTSRDITTALFQFAPSPGTNLQTLELQLDLTVQFTAYYQSANSALVGGTFLYTQPFMLQGDINAIDSVTVTLSNVQGVSLPKSAR